jgi:Ferric reductase like transmembrane component
MAVKSRTAALRDWIGPFTRQDVSLIVGYVLLLVAVFFLELFGNFKTLEHVYGAGNLPFNRALGHVSVLQLGLLLLPVTRNSVFVKVFRLRQLFFEKAVRFHRIAARLFFLSISAHGAWFFVHWVRMWTSGEKEKSTPLSQFFGEQLIGDLRIIGLVRLPCFRPLSWACLSD